MTAADGPALRAIITRAEAADPQPTNLGAAKDKLAEINAEIDDGVPPPTVPPPDARASAPAIAPLRMPPRGMSTDPYPSSPGGLNNNNSDGNMTSRTAEMVSLPPEAWEAVPESSMSIPCTPLGERTAKLKAGCSFIKVAEGTFARNRYTPKFVQVANVHVTTYCNRYTPKFVQVANLHVTTY